MWYICYSQLSKKKKEQKEKLKLHYHHCLSTLLQKSIQENRDLVYVDDINLLGEQNMEVLWEVGLEETVKKTKCRFTYHHQTTRQNPYMKLKM